MTSVAIVGDVHGESRRLRSMLAMLQSFDGAVVFVGDYVNHGADSAGVLEILSGLSDVRPGRFHFLCGNHDVALLRYVEGGDFARFCAVGGLATLASYLPVVAGDVHAAFVSALPGHHLAFLRRLEASWETTSSSCLTLATTPRAPPRATWRRWPTAKVGRSSGRPGPRKRSSFAATTCKLEGTTTESTWSAWTPDAGSSHGLP